MKTSHLNNGVVELPVLCWAETVHLCSTIRSELKLYTSETFYVDLHRTVQLLLIYSCLWLSMAVYSCLWILMTNYDQLWQNGRFADVLLLGWNQRNGRRVESRTVAYRYLSWSLWQWWECLAQLECVQLTNTFTWTRDAMIKCRPWMCIRTYHDLPNVWANRHHFSPKIFLLKYWMQRWQEAIWSVFLITL